MKNRHIDGINLFQSRCNLSQSIPIFLNFSQSCCNLKSEGEFSVY